jgi:hypothetical protein
MPKKNPKSAFGRKLARDAVLERETQRLVVLLRESAAKDIRQAKTMTAYPPDRNRPIR